MTARAGLERLVTEWLHADATISGSDRVLSAALDRVVSVGQARSRPTLRLPDRRAYAGLAVAVAAVVVVVAVIELLPAGQQPGQGTAPASPSAATSTSPLGSQSPAPSSPLEAEPAEAELAVDTTYGADAAGEFGPGFSVPTSGWYVRNGIVGGLGASSTIEKGKNRFFPTARISFSIGAPDGVYADPCRHVRRDPVGRRTETDSTSDRLQHSADLAAAVATIPGMEVSGPSDATVGDLPAKHVVLTVPEGFECYPMQVYLWYDWDGGTRHAAPGDTIRIWIVDYTRFGLRYWIEAETPSDASPELEQEIQQIIDSIVFPG